MDAAPPPLSPPPALEATTIGKYIARFRYEKPQPREARVAAQRSDFWWTRSPRYARSPPRSPSTWASGGDFAFPEGEEEEEKEEEEIEGKINVNITTEEEEKEAGVEDGDSSVDSVESKLRRRLGVWGSDSSLGGEGPNSANVLQAWGSVDWSSVDLEEEPDDEEGEDPEEVIERVRRRLGQEQPERGAAEAAGEEASVVAWVVQEGRTIGEI
ncbi:uncharacterized protein IUM83_18497 [Phytophthora cinnamomi]|uniref:uncharacterized protein n=1 Tax=Phytophthora cinnamomi TaxID=4785 RepID=UPI00355A05B0|nr:hypothetical protein IUM83_18497 [Phytophthora cinnamomi]